MPLADVPKVVFAEVLPMTVKLLGIADANFPEGGQVGAGAPYTLLQVKKFIAQTDYEIALMIAENLEHPYRSVFVTGETDLLADGDLIPAHVGLHSRVTISSGGTEELGQQRDYSRLKRLRKNPALYNAAANLYAIFGNRIYFIDPATTGKLDIPVITKDETYTLLNSPLAYYWAVVAGAIVKAAMTGFNTSHRSHWSQMWLLYAGEIRKGQLALPETEQIERLST